MLFDEPTTPNLLRRLVRRLSHWRAEHDDLIQEGLIHLWSSENQSPGRTRSWYLRGCKLHLRNVMRRGSSVDSPKRRNGPSLQSFNDIEHLHAPTDAEDESGVFSRVCAREVAEILFRHLSPEDQVLVWMLVSGISKRSIALRLNISHTAVQKRHRRIAQTASKIGLVAL
jgi:DNA-directed RNA polymerase specialized sigma24 family protein